MLQKQLMLQPLMVEPFLAHAVLIVIAAMTGRTEAKEDRIGIADIMVAVGCMQVNAIAFSRSSGCPFPSVLDVANLAFPACLFFTLSGEDFPIFGVLFSPFALHTWDSV